MRKAINFLGLNICFGQPDSGLSLSTKYIRDYLPIFKKMGVEVYDLGDICHPAGDYLQFHSAPEFNFANWSSYQTAYQYIGELLKQPLPLLNWGGDHSVGIPTVGAFCNHYPEGYVIWIDAHADLNLPDFSPSGNLHGMPLSLLFNLQGTAQKHFSWITQYLNPQKLIYLGLRDTDPFEKKTIQELGIKYFSAEDVRRWGMNRVAQRIFEICRNEALHISFDIDSISPEYAPSTGIPVNNGLTPQDLNIFAEVISQHKNIPSIDVVEINPTIGHVQEVHATFMIAMNFLKTIFYSPKLSHKRSSYDFSHQASEIHNLNFYKY